MKTKAMEIGEDDWRKGQKKREGWLKGEEERRSGRPYMLFRRARGPGGSGVLETAVANENNPHCDSEHWKTAVAQSVTTGFCAGLILCICSWALGIVTICKTGTCAIR